MKRLFAQPRASIALISLLIISAFTLILVVGMSEVSISSHAQGANRFSAETGYYAAEACLEETLIRLESNPAFTTTTLTFDDDLSCTVSVSGTSPKTVAIQVTYLNYIQNFEAQVSLATAGQATNAQLIGWEEI